MDTHLLKFMPDHELAYAVQSPNGMVPAWAALAELNSRNQIRASAPVQGQPQGTVAQSVVGQALRSAGLSQGPSSSPLVRNDEPQAGLSGGISGGTSGYARGGVVKLASGGGLSDALEGIGMLAPQQQIQSRDTTYDPGVEPDMQAETLKGAHDELSSLYGKGPDYESALKDIEGLKQQSAANSKMGLGQFLSTLIGGTMGGEGTASQNFGAALSGIASKEQAMKQQNLGNLMHLATDKLGVMKSQDERSQNIANAARVYQSTNAQMADAQARAQMANDQGNAERAQSAQHENAELTERRSSLLARMATEVSNSAPLAKMAAKEAAARGDQAGAKLFNDTADSIVANEQAKSDIDQKRQMAVLNTQQSGRLKEMFAEKGIEHQYKMQEQGMSSDGKLNPSIESEAQMLAHYKLHPLSPMSLTRPQAGNIMRRVAEINPNYDGTYFDSINQLRKDSQANGKVGNVATAANTAIQHLDILGEASKALNNGDLRGFNTISQNWAAATGKPAPTNFDALKHQVSGELVSILKKNGIADEHSIQEISKNLDRANSPEQMSGVINQNIQILGGKMKSVLDQVKKTPGLADDDPVFGQIGFSDDSRKSLIHHGFDPSNIAAGPILAGLPAGNGKVIDHDTAVKFLQAAGGDKQRAKKYAADFGWK